MSHAGSNRFDRRHNSFGFTVIELMVVMVITIVLISLMLPSIQQSREAARRAQCKNNLMQIGLALNNYKMAHDVLPPGTQNDTGPIQSRENGGYHIGWITQILPYMEQQNVYNRIDFTKSVYDPINATVRSHPVKALICPTGGKGVGTNSYSGVHNDVEAPIDVDQDGVLFLNSSIDDEQIRDGNSQTIFVMETSTKQSFLGWMSGTRSSLCNAVFARYPDDETPSPHLGARPFVDTKPVYELHASTIGGDNSGSQKLFEELYGKSGREFVGGPSSFHSGLFHVAMGDGSVRAINNDIDAKTLRNLAHRADGEMLDDF